MTTPDTEKVGLQMILRSEKYYLTTSTPELALYLQTLTDHLQTCGTHTDVKRAGQQNNKSILMSFDFRVL